MLRAAVALADRGGIDTLTMRNLGHELGVEAMSLYNHVANKNDLIDGIVDLVYGEIAPPSDQMGWKTAMRQRGISVREALMRHPWATSLMHARTNPGPANLRHHDSLLGTLRMAGFTLVMAAHAISVIDSYIYGFALQQASMPLQTPRQLAKVGEEMLGQMAGDYPHLAEMITDHALQPGYDYSDEFEFGLDLILDGLEQLRETA